MLKTIIVWIFIYVFAVSISFVSELTYKRRSLSAIKADAKGIIRRASLIFLVFLAATYVYWFLGITGE